MFAAAVAAGLVSITAAHADNNGTWTATSSGLWGNTANWSGATFATGPTATADFSQVSLSSDIDVSLDTSYTIGSLIFGNATATPANNWTLDDDGSSGANVLTLAGSAPTITVNNLGANESATISAVIAGNGGLTKAGSGQLIISTAPTFTGNVNVNAGTLQQVNYGANFSYSVGNTTNVATGATLQFNDSSEVDLFGGSYTGTGTILKTGAGTLGIGNNYYNPVTVALSPGGLLDIEGGYVNASNTNEGSWSTNQGSLKIAAGAAFNADAAAVSVDAVTGAGILEGGSWQGGVFPGNAEYLTVGVASGSGTFTGTVQDENYDSPMAIIKNGTGAQVFSGPCTYTGGTTVNGGTLSITGMPGSIFVANSGGTLILNVGSYLYPGVQNVSITGSGTIVKAGAGKLQLGQYQYPTDTFAMGAGGLFDVQAGTFSSGDYSVNTDFSSNLASLEIDTGATFEGVQSNVYVDALTGSGTYQGGYYGPRVLTIGVNNGSGTFSGTITGDTNYEGNASAVIVKTGTGVETLTGSVNIYGAYNTDVLDVEGGAAGTPSTLVVSPTSASDIGSFTNLSAIRIAPNEGDNAVLTATAGTFITSGLSIGNQGDATLNASGSAVFDANGVTLAYTGPTADAAPVFLNVGGSAQINVLNNNNLQLGEYYNRQATVTQTGGTVAFYSDNGSTPGGTGALVAGGGNVETYNLDGGVLSVPAIQVSAAGGGGGGGSLAFNFAGGTLQTLAGSSDFFPTGLSSLTIGAGGGTIDTDGNNVTINQSIAHAGTGSIDGGLTLADSTGTGSLTLTGSSTYTGPTTVSGGTLSITGSIANSGTITVNATTAAAVLLLNGANAVAATAPIHTVGSNAVITVNQNQALGTVDGVGTFNVSSAASISATHIRTTVLNIGAGSTVTITDSPAPGTTAATSVLTDLNNSGTLDLKNNDLIILDTTQYNTVRSLINTAADGGAWDQAGITSSSAKANSASYGLGYATASQAGTTNFDGQSVSANQILAKYTLLGDTQLRGTVGIGDYDTVLSNFGTTQDWAGGNFHYGGSVGIGDYDDVLSNFGAHATGNLASALTRGLAPSLATPALGISPALSKNDIKLEVNTVSGDVYALATTAVNFTGYTVADPSAHLLAGSTSPDPAKLLSVTPGNGGSTNIYETSGQYVDWFKISETASQLAEGQNNNGFANHSSRDDTLVIPSGGTIDFGDIYNTAAGVQDITFNFAEAGTTPTNGPAYYGAEVDYITSTTPEPGSVSLLAIGAIGMLSRRRRRVEQK